MKENIANIKAKLAKAFDVPLKNDIAKYSVALLFLLLLILLYLFVIQPHFFAARQNKPIITQPLVKINELDSRLKLIEQKLSSYDKKFNSMISLQQNVAGNISQANLPLQEDLAAKITTLNKIILLEFISNLRNSIEHDMSPAAALRSLDNFIAQNFATDDKLKTYLTDIKRLLLSKIATKQQLIEFANNICANKSKALEGNILHRLKDYLQQQIVIEDLNFKKFHSEFVKYLEQSCYDKACAELLALKKYNSNLNNSDIVKELQDKLSQRLNLESKLEALKAYIFDLI